MEDWELALDGAIDGLKLALRQACGERETLLKRVELGDRVARAAATLHWLWDEDELQEALAAWRAAQEKGE